MLLYVHMVCIALVSPPSTCAVCIALVQKTHARRWFLSVVLFFSQAPNFAGNRLPWFLARRFEEFEVGHGGVGC